jgi:5-methyltetrahydrofolate--homocysteine methyltransferase
VNRFSVINQNILNGDLKAVEKDVQDALSEGLSADDILKRGLIAAMDEVGRLFEDGEIFVPEMLVSARAMKRGLNILKPLLVDSGARSIGKVVIGTVKGDLHDIGKNLVGMMLEGSGFQIVDLGTDVSAEVFIESIRDEKADIVAMSALLTTTMNQMETTIKVIREAGIRDDVKIIVGGAPVTQEFAEEVGADGYSPDASQATRLAKYLLEK